MHTAYLILLGTCTVAVLALVVRRLLQLATAPRPAIGRQLNEWTWTMIPLAVLAYLLWRALA